MEAVSRFFPDYEIQVKGKEEIGETWEYIYNDEAFDYDDNISFTDSESDSEEEIYIEINKQKYKYKYS